MTPPGGEQVRPLAPVMRIGLLLASGLALVAGLQLYVGTEATDRYFAWTISPPLSAAFLGATYWGSLVLLLLASRERAWAGARVTTVSTLLLVTLLLVVTLVHRETFHTDSDRFITLAGTWAFIAAYVVLPIALAAMLALQLRVPGGDPPRRARLSGSARATLLVHGSVLVVVGGLLLIAPSSTRGLWPWHLTPLMGRAVGAWLLTVGIALALALFEDDWRRLRVPCIGYGALAVLQLGALARYPDTPDWGAIQSWIYVAFLASALLIGIAGYAQAGKAAITEPAARGQPT